MRLVPVKSEDQLDLQSLHRVRERWVMRRTAVVNQIRGLLLECGTTLRKGRRYVDEALPGILAGGLTKPVRGNIGIACRAEAGTRAASREDRPCGQVG